MLLFFRIDSVMTIIIIIITVSTEFSSQYTYPTDRLSIRPPDPNRNTRTDT